MNAVVSTKTGFSSGVIRWKVKKCKENIYGYREIGIVTSPNCIGEVDDDQTLMRASCGLSYTYYGCSGGLMAMHLPKGKDRKNMIHEKSEGAIWEAGQTVKIELDLENHKISFEKDNLFMGYIEIEKGKTYYPAISVKDDHDFKLTFD